MLNLPPATDQMKTMGLLAGEMQPRARGGSGRSSNSSCSLPPSACSGISSFCCMLSMPHAAAGTATASLFHGKVVAPALAQGIGHGACSSSSGVCSQGAGAVVSANG